MLNGIKQSLLEDQKLSEEQAMLSEMVSDDDDDKILDDVDDTVISPAERKKLDAVLKNIPDSVDTSEGITKKDIAATKKVADPTMTEIVKESFDVESLAESLMYGGR